MNILTSASKELCMKMKWYKDKFTVRSKWKMNQERATLKS